MLTGIILLTVFAMPCSNNVLWFFTSSKESSGLDDFPEERGIIGEPVFDKCCFGRYIKLSQSL